MLRQSHKGNTWLFRSNLDPTQIVTEALKWGGRTVSTRHRLRTG